MEWLDRIIVPFQRWADKHTPNEVAARVFLLTLALVALEAFVIRAVAGH